MLMGTRKAYSVTYDLRKPGQSYKGLIDRLKELGAVRLLESYWTLKSTWSAEQIRNDLMAYLDVNDRILVAGLTGEAAWSNPLVENSQVSQALAA